MYVYVIYYVLYMFVYGFGRFFLLIINNCFKLKHCFKNKFMYAHSSFLKKNQIFFKIHLIFFQNFLKHIFVFYKDFSNTIVFFKNKILKTQHLPGLFKTFRKVFKAYLGF